MMVVVVVVVDDDDDETNSIKLKNIKTQVSKISQVEFFFLNVFDFSKTIFQNLVRRGVRGGAGWCRNMKAQKEF
jgi:hypothetical protein